MLLSRLRLGIVLLRNIRRIISARIASNRNFVILIVGDPGIGKSWASMYLAQYLDQNFTVKRICFDASNFITMVRNAHDTIPPGGVIMYDEGSAGGARRRSWFSKINTSLDLVFQTMRFKRHIVLITMPSLKDLDDNIIKRCQAIIEVKKVYKRYRVSVAKFKFIQTNPMAMKLQKDFYFHYINIRVQNIPIQHRYVTFGLPSVKLRHAYEKKKKEFSDDLYDAQLVNLGELQPDQKPGKQLTPRQAQVWELMQAKKANGRYMTGNEIATALGVAPSTISEIKTAIMRAGYILGKRTSDSLGET